MVVPGDTPLLRAETLQALLDQHLEADAACTMVTARLDDPTGYGRVLRGGDGAVLSIVEERDASPEQRRVNEINPQDLADTAWAFAVVNQSDEKLFTTYPKQLASSIRCMH